MGLFVHCLMMRDAGYEPSGAQARPRLIEAERAELLAESEQRQQAEACCQQLAQALQGAIARICDELQLSSLPLATLS